MENQEDLTWGLVRGMMCGRGWNGGRADQEDADSNAVLMWGRDNRKQVILEIISYDFMMD